MLVAMHADIAMRTADALGVDYRPAERQRIEQPPTSSREAYAHYLEARQVLAELGHSMGYSAPEFYGHERLAKQNFEAAVELSPNQAEILAFVAGNYYRRDGRRAGALALLEQVERLNPIDLNLAYFFYLAGDRKTATEFLERAVRAEPGPSFSASVSRIQRRNRG